ncbi:MAG: VCBS repeat-containing protein [Planctomycetes bacterium]|nr:VCBS repeat-containing protein [Planctomycetota bacterium]
MVRLCILGFTACPAAQGAVWHVDDDAPGDPAPMDPLTGDPAEDGTDAHPFDAIQEALDSASAGDEIIVRRGLYTGAGNQDLDFAGRDIHLRCEAPPSPFASCEIDLEAQPGLTAVRFANGEGAGAILEGFRISHGGTGIRIVGAGPTIRACLVEFMSGPCIDVTAGNPVIEATSVFDCIGAGARFTARSYAVLDLFYARGVAGSPPDGGAIDLADSSLELIDGELVSNFCAIRIRDAAQASVRSTKVRDTYDAGGVLCTGGSTLVVEDSEFSGNSNCWTSGGAAGLTDCDATVARSTLIGNDTCYGGGGISAERGRLEIANSIIGRNFAADSGGGVSAVDTPAAIRNGTFVWNESQHGAGGLFSAGPPFPAPTQVVVRSSVFWAPLGEDQSIAGAADVAYSTLPYRHPGPGNRTADPKFVNLGPDPAQWNLRLANVSPAINRGDPDYLPPPGETDFNHEPRRQRCRVDMGAYESPMLGADCNGDGVADSCELLTGAQTDCNGNDELDSCDVESPPIVFQESFPDAYLDPAGWADSSSAEVVLHGGASYALRISQGGFAETRSMDLSAALRASLRFDFSWECCQGYGELEIHYWDGGVWRLTNRDVFDAGLGTAASGIRTVDLPRAALHASLRFRLALRFAFGTRITIDNILVTREEGDCPDAAECNANAYPDACDFQRFVLGRRDDFDVGAYPQSLVAADFDQDGDADLATCDSDGSLHVITNNGFGEFDDLVAVTGGYPRSFVAADLDADGDIDLATPLFFARNLGGLWWGFAPSVALSFPGSGATPQAVVSGDIDQDGDPDLVATFGTLGDGFGAASVLLNDGVGHFSAGGSFETREAPRSLTLFDAEGDGDLDVAVINQSSYGFVGALQVALNEARAGESWPDFGLPILFEGYEFGFDQPFAVASGDFDADGYADLVVANASYDPPATPESKLSILLNRGAMPGGGWAGFAPPVELVHGRAPFQVRAADMNGDKQLDLAAVYGDSNEVGAWMNLGSQPDGTWGGFAPVIAYAVGTRPTDLRLADFNGDGAMDIAVANRATGNFSEPLGTPNISVYLQIAPADTDCDGDLTPDSCQAAAGAGDCDADGVLDSCEADCNANGIPDDCDLLAAPGLDCNANGRPDECDLASGAAADCNANGVPDECESLRTFVAQSGLLFPLVDDFPQAFRVAAPPPAGSDVLVQVTMEAYLDVGARYATVLLNGQELGRIASPGPTGCPGTLGAPPFRALFSLEAAAFDALVSPTAAAEFVVTTTSSLGCTRRRNSIHASQPYVQIRLSYDVLGTFDCNRSRTPDDCDLIAGHSVDLNGNQTPDECDGLGDGNGDGSRGLADAALLSACLRGPAEAPPPSCAPFDFNTDGHVDLFDAHGFMVSFGR